MLCRLQKTSILLASIIGLLLFPSSSLAAGIGVSPGKMDFSIHPGSTETQTLHVINQSNEELMFQVYVEGEYEEWFNITPGEFMLSPQETKGVEVVVAPPRDAKEGRDGFICVVSLPPDDGLRLGTGIKVAAHVQLLELTPITFYWWIIAAVIAVAVGIGLLIWWRRKIRRA